MLGCACADCWPVPSPIHALRLTMALCPASFLNPCPILCVMNPISALLCVCMLVCLPVWNTCTAHSLAGPAQGHWADGNHPERSSGGGGKGNLSQMHSPTP